MPRISMKFDKVKMTGRKTLRCIDCGKAMTRQKTFYQTINPFNVNCLGQPKTAEEIRRELAVEIQEWEQRAEDEQCPACFNKSNRIEGSQPETVQRVKVKNTFQAKPIEAKYAPCAAEAQEKNFAYAKAMEKLAGGQELEDVVQYLRTSYAIAARKYKDRSGSVAA